MVTAILKWTMRLRFLSNIYSACSVSLCICKSEREEDTHTHRHTQGGVLVVVCSCSMPVHRHGFIDLSFCHTDCDINT